MNQDAIETTPERAPVSRFSDVDTVLADLAASGMSTAAFARKHGLSASKLYRLQARANSKRDRGALVPLRVSKRAAPMGAPLELVLSGGQRLLIRADFDEAALRRLMGVLARC